MMAPAHSTPAMAQVRGAASLAGRCVDAPTLLLGDRYYAGGQALTRRLAKRLDLQRGERVGLLTAGGQSQACFVASEFGVAVDLVRPVEGTIPLISSSLDAILSHGALHSFQEPSTAIAEMARVLKPGGRLGLVDVSLDPTARRSDFAELDDAFPSIARARTLAEYQYALSACGLRVAATERHDDALQVMLKWSVARLTVIRIQQLTPPEDVVVEGLDEKLTFAQRAIEAGTMGYVVIVAAKPA